MFYSLLYKDMQGWQDQNDQLVAIVYSNEWMNVSIKQQQWRMNHIVTDFDAYMHTVDIGIAGRDGWW